MKKLIIIDDSANLRKDLKKLLEPVRNIQIVGEAADNSEAVDLCEKVNPDIAILDINLKNSNGIELISQIKKMYPLLIVIMFTNYSNSAFRKSSIKRGADYFFDKTNEAEKLVTALMGISSLK
jgi:DNA-binding NarL/FixJ family response regulator